MKKIILLLLVVCVMISISAFTYLSQNGISFETGSPFDGTYCTSCHSGGASTPTLTITANPAFGTGNTYMASTTYTINVTCSGSYPKYGFDLEIINSQAATGAIDKGTFGTVVTANCKKMTSSGQPTNITHTAPTGSGNTATFSFRWTSPASGSAFLYCACIGANFNGSDTGDKANKTSMTLTQSLTGIASVDETPFDINIYPNPASDFVTLDYTLDENSDIRVDLYDISGKKVSCLVKEKQISGEHHQSINLSELNLHTGVYSIALKAGDKAATKRVVVY